jgi:two-component system, OmpR family, sensor histidine kinase BaeS
LLARLFINLIANAYQYSKANGTIQISLQKINDNIVFAVKDNGIGIADEELPLIWNRFYRGDKSRTVNESNSMGLGLSMVKWISDCHNGTVTVTSKINEGSEFVFSFPQSK